MTETVQMFSALLATLAALGALVVFIAVFLGARGDVLLAGIREVAHWLAFSVAAAAMIGSLYFSEVAEFVPCKLCWYQRIAMYSLAIILVIATVRRDRAIAPYAMVLAALGAGIAGYHWLLERWPSLDTGTCSADAPCSVPYFEVFGFVSLAFMAFSAFVTVLVFLWVVSPASAATIETESESVPH